jgi:hypothetical protein
MGILGKLFAGKMAMKALDRMKESQGSAQYIPAGQARSTSLARSGTAILESAGRFYKENPRKVQALGAVAAAILLTSLKKRRPY